MEYVSTTDDLEDSKCLKEDFLTPKNIKHLGKKLRFCATLKLIRSIDARIMKLCLKIFIFFKICTRFLSCKHIKSIAFVLQTENPSYQY